MARMNHLVSKVPFKTIRGLEFNTLLPEIYFSTEVIHCHVIEYSDYNSPIVTGLSGLVELRLSHTHSSWLPSSSHPSLYSANFGFMSAMTFPITEV